ncbi:MAG: S-layer homology domain-containing protein [Clostridiales bacterium]|nr:S-layer homology domain-containing protein [Clostridiales bacterium]
MTPVPLDPPSNPVWVDTVLKWDAAEHARSYTIILYKDGAEVSRFGAATSVVNLRMNLYDHGEGVYTARVIAVGDGIRYLTSDPSAMSANDCDYRNDYSATTFFYDDFDPPDFAPGDVVGQNGWELKHTGTANGMVVTDPPAAPPNVAAGNALKFKGVTPTMTKPISLSAPVIVLDLSIYTKPGTAAVINLENLNLGNANIIVNGTNLQYVDIFETKTFAALPNDRWHTLRMTLSKVNKSAVYNDLVIEVDGVKYDVKTHYESSYIDAFTIKEITAGGEMYVDNVRMSIPPASSNPLPTASGLQITGSDSGLLTGRYTYNSAIGAAEGATAYRWYTAPAQKGPYTALAGAAGRTYQMTLADTGKWFQCEVTPSDENGIVGDALMSLPYRHMFKPTAQNVCYTDDGTRLTGAYVYDSFDNIPQGGSKFRWLYADARDGQYIPISGEVKIEYSPAAQMRKKFIKFEVTPVTAEGTAGEAALSLPNSVTQTGKELMIAAGKLVFGSISGQSNTRVTAPLTLMAQIDGVNLTWRSNNEAVITNQGAVFQPEYGGNKIVTLTATLTKDGETFTKSFKISVPSLDPYGTARYNPDSVFIRGVHYGGDSGSAVMFLDVTLQDWFYSDVIWAAEQGLLRGVSQELFEPDGLLTARMAEIVAARSAGGQEPPWDDTPLVTRARFLEILGIGTEILRGDENGDLMLEKTLTRAEACAVLHRLRGEGSREI